MNSTREVGKGSKPRPTNKPKYDEKYEKINWNKRKDSTHARTNSHRQPNESTKSNERDCGCCNSTDSDTCGSDNMVLQTKG
jgi:hypothetical protein